MSIKHSQLNEIQFTEAIKNTPTFKGFEKFKQGIILRRPNMMNLYARYHEACTWKIDHLKQNPNVFANDILMIQDVINGN